MATILADLSVLDYDLDLEEIPFSQILLEIRYDGTTVKIPLEQCKYESKGVTYDVDSFLTFRKQFDKGAIFYNGLNLPPRASYDASDLRYVFERSGYVDTADAVNLYGDDVVITDKEVRPTPVNFGNERTITMSEINTGFVTRKATLSSLATREQVEQMKRRIPLGDKYVLVLLDGDQNPQYVRASEISYQLSLDGENWSNSEQISLDGTRGAELYDKLRRGQARLMYNGRYINQIDCESDGEASNIKEYVPETVIKEELIDYDTDTMIVVDPSSEGRDYYLTRQPLEPTFSVFEPGTRSVPNESKPGSTKTEHVFNVTTYTMNNNSGDHVKLTLKNSENADAYRLNQLFVKNGEAYEPIDFSLNVHEVLYGFLGKTIFVKIGDQMFETRPLTQDETVTYDQLKTFQNTNSQMTDETYLLLENGEYALEATAVQPIAYRLSEEGDDVDAYLVEREGHTYVIKPELHNRIKTSPSIQTVGPEGTNITIQIDADTKISKLTRSKSLNNCDVIQTSSKKLQLENAVVLDSTDSEEYERQKESTRARVVQDYKANKYQIDSIYDNNGELVQIDRTKGERFVRSAVRTEHSYAEDTAEYSGLKEKPLTFKVEGNRIVEVKGGPVFDIGKANQEGFKKYNKILGTAITVALSPVGLLTAVAIPFVGTAALAAALIAPVVIPTSNALRSLKKVRDRQEFTDKMLIQRTRMKADIISTLKDLYSQSVEVEKARHPMPIAKYMRAYEGVYAKVASLGPSVCKVEIKVAADGSITCTSDNAYLLSKFRTRYKTKLIELNRIAGSKETLKKELDRLKAQAQKYTKKEIADMVPEGLQRSIERVTRDLALAEQRYASTKLDLEDNYSKMHQEQYNADAEQKEMFKLAECYKIMSIIRLAANEELLALGLTADQISTIKRCVFNKRNLTIKYNGKSFVLNDLIEGNMTKGLNDKTKEMFIELQQIFKKLSNLEQIKSNSATIQHKPSAIPLVENMAELQQISQKVELENSRIKSLRSKYIDLKRIQELRDMVKTFSEGTTNEDELRLIQELHQLEEVYFTDKKYSFVGRRLQHVQAEIDGLKIDSARLDEMAKRIDERRSLLTARKEELAGMINDKQLQKKQFASLKVRLRAIITEYPNADKDRQKQLLTDLNAVVSSIEILNYLYEEIAKIYKENDEKWVRIQNIDVSLETEGRISDVIADNLNEEKLKLRREIESNTARVGRYKKTIDRLLSSTDSKEVINFVAQTVEGLDAKAKKQLKETKIDAKLIGKKKDPMKQLEDELFVKDRIIGRSINRDKAALYEHESMAKYFEEKLKAIEEKKAHITDIINSKSKEIEKLTNSKVAGVDPKTIPSGNLTSMMKELMADIDDQIFDLNEMEKELNIKRVEFTAFAVSSGMDETDKVKYEKKYSDISSSIQKTRRDYMDLGQKAFNYFNIMSNNLTEEQVKEIFEQLKEFYILYSQPNKSEKELEDMKRLANALDSTRINALNINLKAKKRAGNPRPFGLAPSYIKEMEKALTDYQLSLGPDAVTETR